MLKRQRFRFLSNKVISIIFITLIVLSYQGPFRAFYFFLFDNCQKSLRKSSQGVFAGFLQQSLRDFYKIIRGEAEKLLKNWSQAVFGGASWPLKLRGCPIAWKNEKVKSSKQASGQAPTSPNQLQKKQQGQKTVEKTQFLSSSGVDFSPNQRHHYTRSRKGQGFKELRGVKRS